MAEGYSTFQDILDDVLYRAAEEGADETQEEAAKRYILRGYAGLLYGDLDLYDEPIPRWWWLRREDSLIIDGSVNTTGLYNLPSDLRDISSRLFTDKGEPVIYVDYDSLEADRRSRNAQGLRMTPTTFTLVKGAGEDPQGDYLLQAWFNTNGAEDETVDLAFTYFKDVATNVFSSTSEPEMPEVYRKVLADYALYFILVDANDDRADAAGLLVRNTIRRMAQREQDRVDKTDSPAAWRLLSDGSRYRRVPRRLVRGGYSGVFRGPS